MKRTGPPAPAEPPERERAPHGGRYVQWTAYGLLILLGGVLQQTPGLIPALMGVRPALLLPLVIAIAMYTGPVGGAAAGIGAGILMDVFAQRLLGYYALLLLLVGCGVGLLVRLLMRNNLISAALLMLPGITALLMLEWLVYTLLLRQPEPLVTLQYVILPEIIYTCAAAPLVYAAVRGVWRVLKKRY